MRFLVDTNIPLTNPLFYSDFNNQDEFIICWTVLNELDGIKGFADSTGKNARDFLKFLDLHPDSPQFTIATNQGKHALADDNIIEALKKDKDCTLLSNDANMRVKARALGFQAEKYEYTQEDYCGISQLDLSAEDHAELVAAGHLHASYLPKSEPWEAHWVTDQTTGAGIPAVYNPLSDKLVVLHDWSKPVLGILPKNLEQQFLFYFLCNPDIQLVTVKGKAGSGKTLLALAAGLHQVLDGAYNKLAIARSVTPLGNQEIGFLPGSLEDKMRPWLQPIFDNLGCLTTVEESGKKRQPKLMDGDKLIADGVISIEALAFIRGRSIPNEFLLIDECQNLNFHELKTLLTRAGSDTKIVLTGDTDQIDLPKGASGMNRIVSAFKDSKLAAHITLEKTERSALAEEAASRL
jgi:PhoH-like ATPase